MPSFLEVYSTPINAVCIVISLLKLHISGYETTIYFLQCDVFLQRCPSEFSVIISITHWSKRPCGMPHSQLAAH